MRQLSEVERSKILEKVEEIKTEQSKFEELDKLAREVAEQCEDPRTER